MTYSEFRNTYKWTLKKYPDTYGLFNNGNTIRCVIINYDKSGSRWRETSRKEKTVDWEYYMNTVDATPFFRNLGGRETVRMSYTTAGYLPVFISSISPYATMKTTREFIF